MHESAAGLFGDGADGFGIGKKIAPGVRVRAGGLAEHVEGVGVALGHMLAAILQRLADVAAQHELPAHDLHGLLHRAPRHRFAQAFDRVAHALDQVLVIVGLAE